MSEQAVQQIANDLGIPFEQANAVWLKVRQACYKTLMNGLPVDLGFAYLNPHMKPAHSRHNFKQGQQVMVPMTYTIKALVPPHVQDALAGKAVLSPYVFMTRVQIKSLPREELDELARQRLDYYRLKGVTG